MPGCILIKNLKTKDQKKRSGKQTKRNDTLPRREFRFERPRILYSATMEARRKGQNIFLSSERKWPSTVNSTSGETILPEWNRKKHILQYRETERTGRYQTCPERLAKKKYSSNTKENDRRRNIRKKKETMKRGNISNTIEYPFSPALHKFGGWK